MEAYVPGMVSKPGDLLGLLTKLGGDMGFSLRDLPSLITALGDASREIKELNREMPIMPVITAIQELLRNKDDLAEVMVILKGGVNDGKGDKLESPDSGNPGVGKVNSS